MGARSSDVTSIARGLLSLPEIPYVPGCSTLTGMDCQGLVKYCARQSGLTLKYSGSNDMFRNACSGVWPLAQAKRDGKLLPGAALFMLEQDGGEPDKYKPDGKGNASHVGIYIGDSDKLYSVDASASAGKVRARDKRNAEGYVWTHVGWLKGVDYGDAENTLSNRKKPDPDSASETPSTATVGGLATVNADPTVTFRREPRIIPNVDNRIPPCPRIANGERVTTLGAMGEWTNIRYKSWTGWVKTEFLTTETENG